MRLVIVIPFAEILIRWVERLGHVLDLNMIVAEYPIKSPGMALQPELSLWIDQPRPAWHRGRLWAERDVILRGISLVRRTINQVAKSDHLTRDQYRRSSRQRPRSDIAWISLTAQS